MGNLYETEAICHSGRKQRLSVGLNGLIDLSHTVVFIPSCFILMKATVCYTRAMPRKLNSFPPGPDYKLLTLSLSNTDISILRTMNQLL